MATTPSFPPERHIPYKKGGLGAAIATVLAAAGVWTAAWAIHHKTYRSPNDVMMRQVGEDVQPTAAQNAAPVPGAPTQSAPAAGNNASAPPGQH